ncbi:MAG TPA: ABC transporter transmembrane domain-containing protein, partial [Ktedonobacterales bacterium]
METLLATLPYLRRHTARLIIGFFLLIASNLIILLPPLLLGQAIDALSRRTTTAVLVRLALEIVGLAVASGALQFSGRYTIQSVSRYTEYEMRADLFTHFQRLDLAYFQHRKTGDLVARATNDLSAIRMMVGPGLYNLCNTVVLFTLTAIAMVRIEPRLTLYSLTVMPVITVAFIYLGERIRHRFRDVQDQFGEVSAQANENFSGIRTVKAYAQED